MKHNLANLLKKDLAYIFLFAFFISIIIFYGYKIATHKYYQSDFVSFYSSAQILREEPDKLYDFITQTKYQLSLLPDNIRHLPGNHFYPFINPPFFLLPFSAVLSLTPQLGYLAILFSIGVIAVICIWALLKLFPLGKKTAFLIVLLILAYAPTFTTIYLTQSSFTSLFIFIAVYYLLIRNHWFAAGLVSSLLLYKPQLGVVLYLYLILQRNKHLIGGLLIGSLVFFSCSWLLTRGNLFSLLTSLPEFTHQIGAGPKIRITWLGFFHQLSDFIPWLPYQPLTYIFSLATIIWGITKVYRIKPTSKYFPYAYSIIIIITLLSSIHAHYQETVLLLFPLFIYLQKFNSIKLYLVIALGWIIYLLAIFDPFFPQPFLFLPTIYLIALLILLVKHLRILS